MAKAQRILGTKNRILVDIEVVLFKEGEFNVAYCPALELSSYGDSEDDAKTAFEDALNIFLEEASKKGTLEKYLLSMGWGLRQKPKAMYIPPTPSLQKTKSILRKQSSVYNERVAMPV